jgi:hypothetical protein
MARKRETAMTKVAAQQRGVFFLMVVMVKYNMKGVCGACPTHSHKHIWDINVISAG